MMKNASPEVFDEFVNSFEQYVGQQMAMIVNCPREELANYQGRVQQATGILHLLRNCHVELKRPEPVPR